jgi:hypothetical protein
MRMRTIDLDAEYDQLSLWWTKRGLVPPQKVILQGAAGFAVNAGIDIVMGWIYVSGNVAFLEWVTSNPSVATSLTTADALKLLFDFGAQSAKDSGCNVFMCATQDGGSLGKFMVNLGWQACEGPPHQFFVKAIP